MEGLGSVVGGLRGLQSIEGWFKSCCELLFLFWCIMVVFLFEKSNFVGKQTW